MKYIYSILPTVFFLFLLICGNSSLTKAQDSHPSFVKKGKLPAITRQKFSHDEAAHLNPGSEGLRRCYTMEMDNFLRSQYPSMESRENMEKELQKRISVYKRDMSRSKTQATVYTIPVIVHVVHNGQAIGVGPNITAAQVQSQIDVLNEDFRRKSGTKGFNTHAAGADVEIEFALALRDPQGKTLTEPGINRVNGGRASWNTTADIDNVLKASTQWDPNQYLNMWTVQFGGQTASLLGYAQFPSLSGLNGLDKNGGLAKTDGVVMRYTAFGRTGTLDPSFNLGRTTTHEVGHWLGLLHIWGDEDGCTGNDYCSDTPTASGANYGCPTGRNSCSGGGNDMIENYMDYTDDACMSIFTLEQKNRMRTVMLNSPRRKELLNSTVHQPALSNKPLAFFKANQTEGCAGVSITFTDESINSPTSWSWAVYDSKRTKTATSTAKSPNFTFNTAGIYSVSLIVANSSGKDSTYYAHYLTILSSTNTTLPFTEGFEGNTVLPNWLIYNPDGDTEWALDETISAYGTGTWSMVFDNYGEEGVDLSGKFDAVISSKINLSTYQYAEIAFDVAYAMYDESYSDTLVLYYSTDCGKTFVPFWSKGGMDLATAPSTEYYFEPSNTQWRKERISLGFLNGQTSVHLAIGNVSGWGNVLYLDNIRISVPTTTAKPVTSFSSARTSVCVGSTVQFTDNTANVPRTWSWSFPGGTPATSTQQHPIVSYASPGVYEVSLTTSNTYGSNLQTRVQYITVNAKPTLTITADKQQICLGDSVVLTAGGGMNYIWSDKRGIIAKGNSIKVSPTQTNTFTLQGENASQCVDQTSIEIVVNGYPEKPTISTSGTSTSATFTLTSSITTGNQWLLDGKPISGATGQTYDVKAPGSYAVQNIDDGCASKSDAIVLTGREISGRITQGLSVFPNPAQQSIRLRCPATGMATSVRVVLYNNLGGKLQERTLTKEGDEWQGEFQLASYPAGRYVIWFTDGIRQYSQSFIKQ